MPYVLIPTFLCLFPMCCRSYVRVRSCSIFYFQVVVAFSGRRSAQRLHIHVQGTLRTTRTRFKITHTHTHTHAHTAGHGILRQSASNIELISAGHSRSALLVPVFSLLSCSRFRNLVLARGVSVTLSVLLSCPFNPNARRFS